MKRRNQLRNPRRGASMVEFAIAFTLFIGLIFATFDLGGAMWTYTTVTHAAKQAVRFATIHGAHNPVMENGSNVTDEKIKEVAKAAAPGLDPDSLNVVVTWMPDNMRGSNVKVSVSYNHDFLVGEILGIGDSMNLKRTSTMLVVN